MLRKHLCLRQFWEGWLHGSTIPQCQYNWGSSTGIYSLFTFILRGVSQLLLCILNILFTYIYYCRPQRHSSFMNVGGIFGLTSSQMHHINGFSNLYWGWGGEDNDIWIRVIRANFNISRPTGNTGFYRNIKHHHVRKHDVKPEDM